MRYYILIIGLVLILGVIVAFGIVSTGGDILRRRRERETGGTVIADSETEFETDVGRRPDDPDH